MMDVLACIPMGFTEVSVLACTERDREALDQMELRFQSLIQATRTKDAQKGRSERWFLPGTVSLKVKGIVVQAVHARSTKHGSARRTSGVSQEPH